jgi:predicted TPR repeat methyltransferase
VTSADAATLPDWAAGNDRIAALLKDHSAPAALQQFGIEQFQAGENEAAIKAFAAASQLSPDQAIYHNNLGVALNVAGDAAKAIAAFRTSLEIDKGQAQIWLNLAYTYKPLGRLDEAEQALIQAAQYEDTAAEAFASLGMLALERGDYAKAADYLQQAVKGNPGNAVLHGQLGAALFQTGRPGAAAEAYKIAAQLDPAETGFADNVSFLTMLDGVMAGHAEAAITAYAKPLTDDGVLIGAFNRALVFLASFDCVPAAMRLIDEWLQYYPADEDALYFAQVFDGKPISRAPASYVAHHFDRLAGVLDARLLRSIDYHVPEQMAVILAKATGRKWRGDILDAGCGNGALGRALKPFAKTLTGVDLAPRMVALATASGIYDDVIAGDLLTLLQGASLQYDLIAAADSLIYFGALEFVFAAAHAALRPGGWFMLNLEIDNETLSYMVTPHGRFKHAKSYVKHVGAKAFTLLRDKDMMLRSQADKPVDGTIFLFQKV